MATNEELEEKTEGQEPEESDATEEAAAKEESRSKADKAMVDAKSADEETDGIEREKAEQARDEAREVMAPTQLGYRRYVYAAYFGVAIVVAFIGSKLGNLIWYRLSQWKPQWDIGDPKDEIIMPIGAVVGALVAIYYYRRPKSRIYVDEVANELSQVTWPNRKEVTNSTAVVIVTTVFATVFFALMDRFWGFVTSLVYGS